MCLVACLCVWLFDLVFVCLFVFVFVSRCLIALFRVGLACLFACLLVCLLVCVVVLSFGVFACLFL